MTEPDIESQILAAKTDEQRRQTFSMAWLCIKTMAALALLLLMVKGVMHHMALQNEGGVAFYAILAVVFFCALMKCFYNLSIERIR